VVEKSGSWFSFAGERLGQGRETARQFLKDNPVVRQRIEASLREKLGLAASNPPSKSPAGELAQAASKQPNPI